LPLPPALAFPAGAALLATLSPAFSSCIIALSYNARADELLQCKMDLGQGRSLAISFSNG
jgi:hypothetical protein